MNILVCGGGTIAPIDDVRHIANASTGRFAASISEAWLNIGATVWHIHTPNAERPLLRMARLDRELAGFDADRMHELLEIALENWRRHRDRLRLIPLQTGTVGEYAEALGRALKAQPIDAVFLAMAVSDYEPEPIAGKMRSDLESLVLRCRPTPKVIASVRGWAPDAYLVGFKLLSGASVEELVAAAERINRENRCDLTIANDLRHYRAGGHTVHLVRPGQDVETYTDGPLVDASPAQMIVRRVSAWQSERDPSAR